MIMYLSIMLIFCVKSCLDACLNASIKTEMRFVSGSLFQDGILESRNAKLFPKTKVNGCSGGRFLNR